MSRLIIVVSSLDLFVCDVTFQKDRDILSTDSRPHVTLCDILCYHKVTFSNNLSLICLRHNCRGQFSCMVTK